MGHETTPSDFSCTTSEHADYSSKIAPPCISLLFCLRAFSERLRAASWHAQSTAQEQGRLMHPAGNPKPVGMGANG